VRKHFVDVAKSLMPFGERSKMVRIFLVEDNAMMRAHLRAALERTDDWKVVGEAEDGRSAVETWSRFKVFVGCGGSLAQRWNVLSGGFSCGLIFGELLLRAQPAGSRLQQSQWNRIEFLKTHLALASVPAYRQNQLPRGLP
jgi:CheY-like chemotaxis protein